MVLYLDHIPKYVWGDGVYQSSRANLIRLNLKGSAAKVYIKYIRG